MPWDSKIIQSEIQKINTNISDALNEMFSRVHSHEKHKVLDEKEYPKDKQCKAGVLQDCEFGMILIRGRDWLDRHGALRGEIAIDKDVKTIVIEIFERTIKRIMRNNKEEYEEMNVGGALRGSLVFFSGEPYAYNKITETFSANLDAAMIISSFLSSALKYYNNELDGKKVTDLELDNKVTGNKKFPNWIKSLRDLGLFVVNEGFKYALACKIDYQNKFSGFTCDPTSILDKKRELLLEPYDRLFFTWTTCEAIIRMDSWIDYVDKLENKQIAGEIKESIRKLQTAKEKAGVWAHRSFYEKLIGFEYFDVKANIGLIVSNKVEDESKEDLVDDIKKYVMHVYHLSLYATIRSFSPGILFVPEEIVLIVEKINDLVFKDIIESGLDEVKNRKSPIYSALTRYYSLGKSNKDDYADDVYYPLVVKSLSIILRYAVSSVEKAKREEVLKLADKFEAPLKMHVENLLNRRPRKNEDQKLWSIKNGKGYTLYATQRTILALIEYGKFLGEMEKKKKVRKNGKRDGIEKLRNTLAENIANTLLGPDVMKALAEHCLEIKGEERTTIIAQVLPLPESKWAVDVICKWLEKISEDFKYKGIADFLYQKAQSIIWIWGKKDTLLELKKVADDQKETARNNLNTLKNSFKKILSIPRIGTRLNSIYESNDWDINKIIPLLFEYLFFEAMAKERLPGDITNPRATDLWGYIGIFKSP